MSSTLISEKHLTKLTKRLMKILESNGFGEPLLSWFRSYLTNHTQYIKVFGVMSELNFVPPGMPQRGHLSPILFFLFINSIKCVIHNSQFLLFADDLK